MNQTAADHAIQYDVDTYVIYFVPTFILYTLFKENLYFIWIYKIPSRFGEILWNFLGPQVDVNTELCA